MAAIDLSPLTSWTLSARKSSFPVTLPLNALHHVYTSDDLPEPCKGEERGSRGDNKKG